MIFLPDDTVEFLVKKHGYYQWVYERFINNPRVLTKYEVIRAASALILIEEISSKMLKTPFFEPLDFSNNATYGEDAMSDSECIALIDEKYNYYQDIHDRVSKLRDDDSRMENIRVSSLQILLRELRNVVTQPQPTTGSVTSG